MVAMAVDQRAIERVAYRPLRNAPKLAPLISAIGMSYVLQNVGLVSGGAYQRTIDSVFPTTNLLAPFGITGIAITPAQVFVGIVTIPLLIALSLFVSRTRQGRAMRATAQDPDTAGLMGVDVNRTIAITFLIGGALAGAAGVVQLLYNNYTVYTLGFRFGLNSFTAAVLGGIGNLQGAVLGALVIGEINALSDSLPVAELDPGDRVRRPDRDPRLQADRPPRPAAGGPGMSARDRHRSASGLGGWLGYLGARSRRWPAGIARRSSSAGAGRSA